MKTFNVLSIDYDYFVKCSADYRDWNFPDGGNENLPSTVIDCIWQSRYATTPDLDTIDILEDEFDTVSELVINLSKKGVPVYYFDSHKYAFDIITNAALQEIKLTNLKITNIDFHSDVYDFGVAGDTEPVDCGNWFRKIVELFNLYGGNSINKDYLWIARDDSDKSPWVDSKVYYGNLVHASDNRPISQYLDEYYDLIYICRSGAWTPPHLDNYLGYLLRSLKHYSGEEFQDRYTKNFISGVEQIRKSIPQVFKDFPDTSK